LTERHARRSVGLKGALVAVGLALAGRAGARLAATLGIDVSRSTLLRLIRGLPDPPVGRVTVLGVDDFALRRRHHYGTVLVDLAGGHRPVDVFIGREAEDFAGWLRAHPGVEVICRDRAGAYADGARDGAPDATQVADRWHLWDNLCRHVERLVAAHHACLPEPVVPAPHTGPDPGDPVDPVVPPWPDTARIEHTRQRYDQTHDLREQGLSMRAIARKLDLNFKTIRRYLRAESVDTLLAGGVRASVLDSFKPYLHDRLADGERNATVLHVEIAERGYTGGYKTLARYLRPLRCVDAAALAGLSSHPGPPAVRRVAGWITGLPGHLDPADVVLLHAIRVRCPELDAAVRADLGGGRSGATPLRPGGGPSGDPRLAARSAGAGPAGGGGWDPEVLRRAAMLCLAFVLRRDRVMIDLAAPVLSVVRRAGELHRPPGDERCRYGSCHPVSLAGAADSS